MSDTENEKPVRLRVRFSPPETCTIELQGRTLEAYRTWLEDQDDSSEEWLAEEILYQCMDHIEMWTGLEEWDHA